MNYQQSYCPSLMSKLFFLYNTFRTNEWILIKIYGHIDIDYL